MNLRFVTSDSDSNSSFGWQKVSRNKRIPEIHITPDMASKIKQEREDLEAFEPSDEEQLTVSKKVISKTKKSNKQLNISVKREITSELENKINGSSETSDTNNIDNGAIRLSKNQLHVNKNKHDERDLTAAESDDSDDNHQYSFQTNNSLSLFNGLETFRNSASDDYFEYKDVSYKDLLNRSNKDLDNDSKLITSSIIKKDKLISQKKALENNNISTNKQINISGQQRGNNNSFQEEASLRKTTKQSLHVNKDNSVKKVYHSISESESPKKRNGIISNTSTVQYKNKNPMNNMFGISKDIFSDSDPDSEENNLTMQSPKHTYKRVQSEKIDTYLETNDSLNAKNTNKFPKINITSDDEIWIVQCPKTIDPNTLVNENLFDPTNLQCVATKNDNLDNSVSVVLGVNLMSFKVKGNILVKEKSKEMEENNVEVPINSNAYVPFPSNFITRHPLLGANYKEKLYLSDDIKERFVTVKKENSEINSSSKTGEKRKKRKRVISDNKSDEPSPKKKKSKHSNQMWTTEDAIERNLFCDINTKEAGTKKEKKRKSIKNA